MRKVVLLMLMFTIMWSSQAQTGKFNATRSGFNDKYHDSLDENVRASIATIYQNVLYDSSNYHNIDSIESDAVKKYGITGEQVILTEIGLYYYLNKNFSKWISVKKKLIRTYPTLTDIRTLNNDAWHVFESTSSKEDLEAALLWSKVVIAAEPTANYYDTYANILYRLGRREEAVKTLKKGLTLPIGNGILSEMEENLDKMQRGEKTWKE
jgi:tetratricopeptide (TPR) repeat protein